MKHVSRKELGKQGEDIAALFLENQGYKIIERNHRNKLGEIDIIAVDGSVLCFIEVKTRTTSSFGFPEEAVKRKKQRKISQIVLSYLKLHKRKEADCRFDVAAVSFNKLSGESEVNLIKHAFELDSNYFF